MKNCTFNFHIQAYTEQKFLVQKFAFFLYGTGYLGTYTIEFYDNAMLS